MIFDPPFFLLLALFSLSLTSGYRPIPSIKYFSKKINTKSIMHLLREDKVVSETVTPPKSDFVSSFKFYLLPETVAILSVYFVQGALGLSRLAVTFFLKDELHLLPAESAALLGFTSLPWLLKPIYGFLSDGFPLWGYKRRSYLVLAGLIGCLSWVCLGTIVHDSTGALAAILIGSGSIAVSDVVVDSIVVERSRVASKASSESDNGVANVLQTSSEGADLQSLCWSASSIGAIASAYFSGSLLQQTTPRVLFLYTAIFPLIIAAVSLLINEKKQIASESDKISATSLVRNIVLQLRQVFETMRNPGIYLPILFIFLWQATPSADSALFYFTTNELKFDPEFLGRIRLASSIASLAGVLTYRYPFSCPCVAMGTI